MNAIGWILRLLLIMFVVRWIFGAVMPTQPRRSRPSAPSGGGERSGGTLVRDPQCGTYVPQSKAIRVGSGTDAQYFCSNACRDAYRAAQSSVA